MTGFQTKNLGRLPALFTALVFGLLMLFGVMQTAEAADNAPEGNSSQTAAISGYLCDVPRTMCEDEVIEVPAGTVVELVFEVYWVRGGLSTHEWMPYTMTLQVSPDGVPYGSVPFSINHNEYVSNGWYGYVGNATHQFTGDVLCYGPSYWCDGNVPVVSFETTVTEGFSKTFTTVWTTPFGESFEQQFTIKEAPENPPQDWSFVDINVYPETGVDFGPGQWREPITWTVWVFDKSGDFTATVSLDVGSWLQRGDLSTDLVSWGYDCQPVYGEDHNDEERPHMMVVACTDTDSGLDEGYLSWPNLVIQPDGPDNQVVLSVELENGEVYTKNVPINWPYGDNALLQFDQSWSSGDYVTCSNGVDCEVHFEHLHTQDWPDEFRYCTWLDGVDLGCVIDDDAHFVELSSRDYGVHNIRITAEVTPYGFDHPLHSEINLTVEVMESPTSVGFSQISVEVADSNWGFLVLVALIALGYITYNVIKRRPKSKR